MKITVTNYRRLASAVGILLTLMGLSLTAVFVVFLATGNNAFAETPVALDGPGLLILASIGAFALPLGASLLLRRDHTTSLRLQLAGGALGLMALIRLAGFVSPEIRASVGTAPLVEFFVLGAIALAAYFLRPEDESPIETRMEVEVQAPASEAWRVLGEEFGEVGEWASGLLKTSVDREVGVGAVRTCDIEGFGPFPAAQITEELTSFDREAMRFTYAATSGIPRMFEHAQNRWSVEPLGSGRCRVRSHASIEMRWWALPLAAFMGRSIQAGVERFGEDLRHRVETGRAHPRKVTANGS